MELNELHEAGHFRRKHEIVKFEKFSPRLADLKFVGHDPIYAKVNFVIFKRF